MKDILELISYAKRKNSGILMIDDEKMIETIEESLEKQIPKKPIKHITLLNNRVTYLCPTCNRLYWDKEFLSDYCNSCGQKFKLD